MEPVPQASVVIPRDLIEPVIQAHIQAAITNALGGQALLVRDVVKRVIEVKVDSEGKVNSYGSYNTHSWINWVTSNVIQKAVKDCLEAEIKNHEGVIRKMIADELAKKKSPLVKALVQSMTGALIEAASSKYRLTVNVAENKD